MYILVNRDKKIVDTVMFPRYVKLQSSPAIFIGCELSEGPVGVIGSDSNTFYPLISADAANAPNAVSLVEIEELPENFILGYFSYVEDEIVETYTIAEVQQQKQAENITAFEEYVNSQYIEFNNKQYGISQENQNEIAFRLLQNEMSGTALEWHAHGEEDVAWSKEDLTELMSQIAAAIYPIYHKMQQYKAEIYSCETLSELVDMTFTYTE